MDEQLFNDFVIGGGFQMEQGIVGIMTYISHTQWRHLSHCIEKLNIYT